MQKSVLTATGRRARLIWAISVMALPVAAQSPSLTTLYSFTGGTNGAHPESEVLLESNGQLFGTTPYGGTGGTQGLGTVYQLTPGSTWSETVIHSFQGGSDGAIPQAGLAIGTGGVLYGTTSAGGSSNNGTAYQLTPPGTSGGAWKETVI